ncbi:hypothetical protein ACFL6U_03255 [Planctomycetota bacterium]
MTPPSWAYMERALLRENVRLVERFTQEYVNPETGYFECVETWGGANGPDDVMENFYNWPLLYTLGASQSTLDLFYTIWNGHIRQYSNLGMFYREFIASFDWEHNGEAYAGFNLLPLSDPLNPLTQQRMTRFSNFYTGRDTTVHNYDAAQKIILSMHNGSKDPRYVEKMESWPEAENFVDDTLLKGKGILDGDNPLNMISTTLATNAYMLTGDDHYRDWVLEYAGAWLDRAKANNGIIPSNVGHHGIVGEKFEGKWYQGFFAWDYWFGGWGILGRGMRIGFSNAYLLSGDQRYVDALRKQGQALLKNKIKTDQGPVFLNKYGDEGWYEEARYPSHYSARNCAFEGLFADVYLRTLEESDLSLLYEAAEPKPSLRKDKKTWLYEFEDGHYDAGNEVLWIDYLQGNFPEYPLKALGEAFERIRIASDLIRKDDTTPDTRRADSSHGKKSRESYEIPNGIIGAVIGSLINLTMGGPQPLWSGGLLHCQLRYFDPDKRRPGLPEDVVALVTKITKQAVHVTLVNMNQMDSREVIIQTGAYGEHRCDKVDVNGQTHSVGDRSFHIRLAPGAGASIVVHRTLMANRPTLTFPWQSQRWPMGEF